MWSIWIDVGIQVGIAVATMAMAYLGVYVTLHPAKSKRRRNFYKAGFLGCAFLAVSLVIWQGFRTNSGQRELTDIVRQSWAGITDLQRRATQPVEVKLPPIQLMPPQPTRPSDQEIAARRQARRDIAQMAREGEQLRDQLFQQLVDGARRDFVSFQAAPLISSIQAFETRAGKLVHQRLGPPFTSRFEQRANVIAPWFADGPKLPPNIEEAWVDLLSDIQRLNEFVDDLQK